MENKKIGVFRALELGDMLCAMPAIQALRDHYPLAVIILIGLPWSVILKERYPSIINSVMVFPGYEGLPEQPFEPQQYAAFLKEVREENFDLLLQMQGKGTVVNEMMQEWGARRLVGFHNSDSRQNETDFCEYPEKIPEPLRHLTLLRHLGIMEGTAELFFPLRRWDLEEVRDLELPRRNPYVCVHAGSSNAKRRWAPNLFAEVADYIASLGYRIMLTGTKEENILAKSVIMNMQKPEKALILCGQTSLGGMGWLLKHATMLIANCTGISHLAAAVQTPSVIISMDGEPERWAPVNQKIHRVFDWLCEPKQEQILNAVDELLALSNTIR